MAGLLQTFNDVGIDRLPGAGKTPVLGSLFSSKSYQRRETDLVIIVTPHLVRPIDPSKRNATPFDSTLPRAMSTCLATMLIGHQPREGWLGKTGGNAWRRSFPRPVRRELKGNQP